MYKNLGRCQYLRWRFWWTACCRKERRTPSCMFIFCFSYIRIHICWSVTVFMTFMQNIIFKCCVKLFILLYISIIFLFTFTSMYEYTVVSCNMHICCVWNTFESPQLCLEKHFKCYLCIDFCVLKFLCMKYCNDKKNAKILYCNLN